MGIQIKFYPVKPATYYERIRDRIKGCHQLLKFLNGVFFPREIDVWFSAPSEALGGRLARRIRDKNMYLATEELYQYLKDLPFEDATNTIVIFKGLWELDDIKLEGYFSIQNYNKWREVYDDIEISAYAKGEFEDIVDALWHSQDMTSLIPKLLLTLQQGLSKTSLGVSQVTFSRGIPTKEDPTNLMAIYLTGERRSLLGIFYYALRETRDPKVITKATPLNTRFLLNTLVKEDVVNDRIEKRLLKSLVIEKKGKSALYIAKERNSFATLYREISGSVLKPALEKLPKADNVKKSIRDGLNEYRE